jgi:hypothetical protein
MLEFLFGPKNPTKDWQRIAGLRLDCDLMEGTLNGVRLGETFDRLCFLGPVEDRSGLRLGEYRYFSLGLSIGCYNAENLIDFYELVKKDAAFPQYREYAGRCQFGGRDVPLHQMTEPLFVKAFGLPYWRDEDDEEAILFYEWPRLEWQVECALAGNVNRIIITRSPLMADSDQRKAYGVDRPWPPEKRDWRPEWPP